jgi:hypothetical protein
MFRKIAAAILVAAALTSTTGADAGNKFDGAWSVVVYTKKGPCDAAYRFSGQIVNGEISYAYSSLTVRGSVLNSGAIYVHVTAGTSHGSARGRMTGTQGGGTWSGVGPDGPCAGTWAATRQSAM